MDDYGGCENSHSIKIALFYKTLVHSISFVIAFVSLISIPSIVSANSQTAQLLDTSSMLIENAVKGTTVSIVEDQALSYDFGVGLETLRSDGIGMIVYTVEKGDTISEIAEYYDISTNTIRWENNISGSKLKIGQKLNILPVTGVKHIIKKGDTLTSIAKKYDAEINDIYIFNGIDKNDKLKQKDILFVPNGVIKSVVVKKSKTKSTKYFGLMTTKVQVGDYIRPATGRITSPYGSRWGSFHYGIDIGNRRGSPVFAAASGTIIKTVSYCVERRLSCGGRYGNYIIIQHPNSLKTKYAHLSKLLVNIGDVVVQGQTIGLIGNTGRSTGPHLHFEIENANGSRLRPSFK